MSSIFLSVCARGELWKSPMGSLSPALPSENLPLSRDFSPARNGFDEFLSGQEENYIHITLGIFWKYPQRDSLPSDLIHSFTWCVPLDISKLIPPQMRRIGFAVVNLGTAKSYFHQNFHFHETDECSLMTDEIVPSLIQSETFSLMHFGEQYCTESSCSGRGKTRG